MFDEWYINRFYSDIPNTRDNEYYAVLFKENPKQAAYEIGEMYFTTRLYSVRDIDIALYWLSKAYELGQHSVIVCKYLIYLYIVSGEQNIIAKIKPLYKKLPDNDALYKKILDAFFEIDNVNNGYEKIKILRKHLSKSDYYDNPDDTKNLKDKASYNDDSTDKELFSEHQEAPYRVDLNHNKILVEKWLRSMKAKLIEETPTHDSFYDNQQKHPLLNLFIEAYKRGYEDKSTTDKIYQYADNHNMVVVKFFLEYILGNHGKVNAYDRAIKRSDHMGLEAFSDFFQTLKTGKRRNMFREFFSENSNATTGDVESRVKELYRQYDSKIKERDYILKEMREELTACGLYDGNMFIDLAEQGSMPTATSSKSYLLSIMKYPFYSNQLETMFRAAGMGITTAFDNDFALSLVIMIWIKNPDYNFYRGLNRDDVRLLVLEAIHFSQFSLFS